MLSNEHEWFLDCWYVYIYFEEVGPHWIKVLKANDIFQLFGTWTFKKNIQTEN